MADTVNQPRAGRKRALVVVDAQPATLTAASSLQVLAKIRDYVQASGYEAYVLATYSAPESSMFSRQSGWSLELEAGGPNDAEIVRLAEAKGKPLIHVAKTVRSVLKAEGAGRVALFLEDHGIDELHFVGFDINDCILATAYDAIDCGFFSFVLEEFAFRADGNQALVDASLQILRHQGMTDRTQRFPAHRVALETCDTIPARPG